MGVYLSVSPPDGFESWDDAAWEAWFAENPWEPAELLADRGHWLVFLYQARVHAPKGHAALGPFLERLMNERPIPADDVPSLADAFDVVARELGAISASRLWTGTQFYTADELHALILRAEQESGRSGLELRIVDLWQELFLRLDAVLERAAELGRGVYFGNV